MQQSPRLETNLQSLSQGNLIALPTAAGWMLAGDAEDDNSAARLLQEGTDPVLLLTEERDLLKYVSALDLNVVDIMASDDAATAFYFENVLKVADCLLGKNGSIHIALTKDDYLFSLMKRSRKALALVQKTEDQLITLFGTIPEIVLPFVRNGWRRKKFV